MIVDLVRSTCEEVVKQATYVKINLDKVRALAEKIHSKPVYLDFFECDFHMGKENSDEDLIAYAFVIDALNFCFWPSKWEYDNLARSIKDAHFKNNLILTPQYLSSISDTEVKDEFFGGIDFPLLSERGRALREIGKKTIDLFDGQFSNIIKKADGDASTLLELIASTFLMFQDHCIYNGKQVYFYKRAQILVGDLFGIFSSKQSQDFEIKNIERITCFADYRIPQLLLGEGVLEYNDELLQKVKSQEVFIYGCPEEVEIRAAMITAVELLKDELQSLNVNWSSVEIDWLLWQVGEEKKDELIPHHRVLSIFY